MQRNGQWIDRIWKITLVMVVFSQLFFLAIRTETGARKLPAAFVKMGLMKPRQVGFLLKSLRPDDQGVVRSLISQIHAEVPADSKLEIVWSGTPLMIEVAELNYALYPRPISQRAGQPGDSTDSGCRIDWGSDTDVTLTCPGYIWKFDANSVVQR